MNVSAESDSMPAASQQTGGDRLELLPISLLAAQGRQCAEFRRVARRLGIELGWHYLLDFLWAARWLAPQRGCTVLDAGASLGVMQWWLAAQGVNVISIDIENRREVPRAVRRWCPIRYMEPVCGGSASTQARCAFSSVKAWLRSAEDYVLGPGYPSGRGTVTLYDTDLRSIPRVADNSVDAVVSISAIEHNDRQDLPIIVGELLRVLKPGGRLAVTVPAAHDVDWYHEPSKGWCFSEATLRELFPVAPTAWSNFNQYDAAMTALRNCDPLRKTLARMYFKSGEGGMPWGVWDPAYVPAGVFLTKPWSARSL